MPELGNENWHQAITLDPSEYTSDNPLWQVIVELPKGKKVAFQYFRMNSDANVTWEGGSQKLGTHMYTVPGNCSRSNIVEGPSNIWPGTTASNPATKPDDSSCDNKLNQVLAMNLKLTAEVQDLRRELQAVTMRSADDCQLHGATGSISIGAKGSINLRRRHRLQSGQSA